jgi:hypothetical protein
VQGPRDSRGLGWPASWQYELLEGRCSHSVIQWHYLMGLQQLHQDHGLT